MHDAEYETLYGVLNDERTFKEWPKKQQWFKAESVQEMEKWSISVV